MRIASGSPWTCPWATPVCVCVLRGFSHPFSLFSTLLFCLWRLTLHLLFQLVPLPLDALLGECNERPWKARWWEEKSRILFPPPTCAFLPDHNLTLAASLSGPAHIKHSFYLQKVLEPFICSFINLIECQLYSGSMLNYT